MAHFAELDENNKVLRVCVVDDAYVPSDMHVDGEIWCQNFWGGKWKQTSYTGKFRGIFCNIGDKYDPVNDVFIPFKPFPNWVWSDSKNNWVAPVADPSVNANEYGASWDQENNRWSGVNNDGVGVYWDPDTSSWKNQ